MSGKEEEKNLERGREKARQIVKIKGRHKAMAQKTAAPSKKADVIMMVVVFCVIVAALWSGYCFSRQKKEAPENKDKKAVSTQKNRFFGVEHTAEEKKKGFAPAASTPRPPHDPR